MPTPKNHAQPIDEKHVPEKFPPPLWKRNGLSYTTVPSHNGLYCINFININSKAVDGALELQHRLFQVYAFDISCSSSNNEWEIMTLMKGMCLCRWRKTMITTTTMTMMTMTTLITNGDDDDVDDYEYNDRDQCRISCVESRSSKPLRATSDLTFGSLSKRGWVSLRMSKIGFKTPKTDFAFLY